MVNESHEWSPLVFRQSQFMAPEGRCHFGGRGYFGIGDFIRGGYFVGGNGEFG